MLDFIGKIWYNKKAAKSGLILMVAKTLLILIRTIWVINQEGGGNNE